MEQDGLLRGSGEQGFQLFAPRRNPGEVVLDLGGRNAVFYRLNDVVAGLGELCVSFGRAERSVLFVSVRISFCLASIQPPEITCRLVERSSARWGNFVTAHHMINLL